MKSKDVNPTHKQKDFAMEQLLTFVHELAINEVMQSSMQYMHHVGSGNGFKFDRAHKANLFAFVRRDMDEVKEIWESCAFKVYKDHNVSEKLIKIFFNNCVNRVERAWEKQYKFGKNGITKRAKA